MRRDFDRELTAVHTQRRRAVRNGSILAHGFRPVQKPDWERMQSWTRDRFLPALQHLSQESGLKSTPEQLPAKPLALLRETG